MVEIGKFAKMTVAKQVRAGYLLAGKEGEEILLSNNDVPNDIATGEQLKVFIYKNSKQELVATTKKPTIALNEFAFLQVKSNTEHGTFLEWGLDKDLFVPFSEQPDKMKEGNKYLVYLYFDEKSERLAASAKTNKFLESKNIDLKTGQEVSILITGKKEIGYTVIINNRYRGMIYKNEIFKTVNPGDTMTAYVKNVREDGKTDISLQKPGYKNIASDSERLLQKLKDNQGVLHLNDNSRPEEIQLELQMSKKAFKRTLGNLYKQKKVDIKNDGIYLKSEPFINENPDK